MKRKADSLGPWEFGNSLQHMCISQIRKYGRPRAESIVHYQSQVACIVRKTRKLLRPEPGTDFVGRRRDAPPLLGPSQAVGSGSKLKDTAATT